MKKYDVYGLGNALVDMEFKVTDEFIKQNNIAKGHMTLVDEKRQEDLGSVLSDQLHGRACGGSAANSVIAVSQLGGRSYYSCKVAGDETGLFYSSDLGNNGVHSNLAGNLPNGTTGTCMVFVTPDAERSMETHLGITQTLSKDQIVEEELKSAEYLYMEGYLMPSPTAKKAAMEAKKIAVENGVKTALTFSDPSMAEHFRNDLKDVIGTEGLDLLFCNEEEAKIFTETSDLDESKEQLKKYSKAFVITLGSKGALVYDGKEYINIAPHAVTAVDSNGAGDMFAGAFLFGVTQGYNFKEAGELASRASSEVVTKFGPRLDKNQTQKVLTKYLAERAQR